MNPKAEVNIHTNHVDHLDYYNTIFTIPLLNKKYKSYVVNLSFDS